MSLFTIAQQIEHILAVGTDPVTGEISPEALEELTRLDCARDERLRDMACYAKGERAEAASVRAVMADLEERAQRHERRAEQLETAIGHELVPGSQRLSDGRVEVAWRRNPPRTFSPNDTDAPAEFMREKVTRTPDRTAIKAALQNGREVPGWSLVSDWRLVIR